MTPKPKRLPKLTDAERHRRFVEIAHKVEASDDPKDFDRAFDKVLIPNHPESPKTKSRP